MCRMVRAWKTVGAVSCTVVPSWYRSSQDSSCSPDGHARTYAQLIWDLGGRVTDQVPECGSGNNGSGTGHWHDWRDWHDWDGLGRGSWVVDRESRNRLESSSLAGLLHESNLIRAFPRSPSAKAKACPPLVAHLPAPLTSGLPSTCAGLYSRRTTSSPTPLHTTIPPSPTPPPSHPAVDSIARAPTSPPCSLCRDRSRVAPSLAHTRRRLFPCDKPPARPAPRLLRPLLPAISSRAYPPRPPVACTA